MPFYLVPPIPSEPLPVAPVLELPRSGALPVALLGADTAPLLGPTLVAAAPEAPAVPVGPTGPATPLGATPLVPLETPVPGVVKLAQSVLKPALVDGLDGVAPVVVPIVPGGHGAAVAVEAPIELLLMPGPPVLVLPPAVVPCASANRGAVASATANASFLVMSKSPLGE